LAKSSYGFERLQREKEKAAKAEAKKLKREASKAAASQPERAEGAEQDEPESQAEPVK
jgi:hypothetical protein